MNISEAIRIALFSLWANKLRSFLTLLGVVIGVAAVIAVVTFVNGINGYVAEKIFNLGADVFIISKMPNVVTDADQFIEGNRRKDITMEHYEAVAEGCTACNMVGASIWNDTGKVVYGTREQHRQQDSRLDADHDAAFTTSTSIRAAPSTKRT